MCHLGKTNVCINTSTPTSAFYYCGWPLISRKDSYFPRTSPFIRTGVGSPKTHVCVLYHYFVFSYLFSHSWVDHILFVLFHREIPKTPTWYNMCTCCIFPSDNNIILCSYVPCSLNRHYQPDIHKNTKNTIHIMDGYEAVVG